MNEALIRPVTGMKLDIRMSKGTGMGRHVLLMVTALAGMVSGAAADEFAGLADPTQPAYGAAASVAARPRGPVLQSTFITASQRRAVIGGRSYAVGDKFGGGTITEIQPYEVVTKTANRETRLRLLPKLAKETHVVKAPARGLEGGQK